MKLEKPTLFQFALMFILIIFCTLYYQQRKIGTYVFSSDNDALLDTRNGNTYFIDENTIPQIENGKGKWKIGVKMN